MGKRSTTTKLAAASLRANKSRTVLICISIMLTTMLLTILALAGYGIVKENKANAGVLYGEHYGAYVRVTPEIYENMRIHSEFYDVGTIHAFGEVRFQDADGVLSYMDGNARKLSHAQAAEGTFPEKEREIAGQKGFFEKAGYHNPEIGDTVEISYRIGDGQFLEGSFVISGFIKETEANELQKTYGAYVSEAFYESEVPETDRSFTVCFKVKGAEELNEAQMGEKIYSLAESFGVKKQQVIINSAYLMWLFDPGLESIVTCIGIAVLVVFFSVLVIYNIFYVGMIQKIQEYGKLCAIGMTKKQIRSMLYKEGMMLAGIGITAGSFLGILFSNFFFQWLMGRIYQELSVDGMETISVICIPLIFLAAGISFAAVFLSLLKPMRMAARISPVEAMRYQEYGNKKMRRGYHSMNVTCLMLSNLSRNKKRTVTTILTMGLSCVLFVVAANVVGNMDAEYAARNDVEKGDFHIEIDASLEDEAYPENNLNHVQQLGLMNPDWQKQLAGIEGVTRVETRKGILALREYAGGEEDEMHTWVKVLSKEDYEKLEAEQGSIDYGRAYRQQEILFGSDYWMDAYGYAVGDQVKLTFYDGDREIPMEYTLTGSAEGGSLFILTEEQLDALHVKEDMTTDVWISCEKAYTEDVETEIRQMISSSDYYELTTYQDAYRLENMAVGMMKGASYALLFVIGMIGFMNMANTVITGIVTRRKELGMLQAIGMTGKQLNFMLQMEGILFTAGTSVIALTFGNVLGYLAFLKCKAGHVIGISVYHIPFPELLGMVLILFCLQMILSGYMSHCLQKDALTERVRYQE